MVGDVRNTPSYGTMVRAAKAFALTRKSANIVVIMSRLALDALAGAPALNGGEGSYSDIS